MKTLSLAGASIVVPTLFRLNPFPEVGNEIKMTTSQLRFEKSDHVKWKLSPTISEMIDFMTSQFQLAPRDYCREKLALETRAAWKTI